MVSGSTCILAGIIGWTGTVGEKAALLSTYSGCMVVILTAEIAGAVVAFLLYDKTTEKIEPRLNLTFFTKYNKAHETTKAVDKMQRELRCCGVEAYTDWTDTQPYGREISRIPVSCCKNTSKDCDFKNIKPARKQEENIYHLGCLFALSFWMRTRLLVMGWITAGCACWQVIGISCVCCFHKAVTDGYG
ncbi:CD63 antigen-like [Gigantopelta aegis]|uniref:CD63 antigen-like n=1 Tax=Gigantopelta aegis TaxID=1735272 RepID=UPI001B88ADD9|nr:CD63 antigen-like [Gigantopelta aegis]